MPGPESKATKIVLDRLNAMVGCRAVKVHAQANMKGWLDIDAVFWGISVKIEMKAPGKLGNLSRLQKIEIKELREVGGIAGPASEWAHVLAILRENKRLLIAAYQTMTDEVIQEARRVRPPRRTPAEGHPLLLAQRAARQAPSA